MQHTHLHDLHLALGARMVPYAGWALPVQYTAGPIREHLAVRQAGGLFDISHMARLRIEGADARLLLQKVLTRDLKRSRPGRATYSLMTYADGTIVDDVIVTQFDQHWLLVGNGANRDKDRTWLVNQARGLQVTFRDETEDTAMMACQGPQALAVLSQVLDTDLQDISRFQACTCLFQGVAIEATRTGYTGEDGFEIVCLPAQSRNLFAAILEAGAPAGLLPCGLAARDSLRLEACYPLYGQEIDSTINPLEANLAWAVSFRKPDYIGRDALLKCRLEQPQRQLLGFVMTERGVPRTGYDVYQGNDRIGRVTSGNKSPSLDLFIGLALCRTAPHPYTEIAVDIRGQRKRAQVVPIPFLSKKT